MSERDFDDLVITTEFETAFEVMNETTEHVFISGNAGTGKSTLLEFFKSKTAKKMAVLAPTGVAAVNVKGQTIHSFFGFKPSVTVGTVRKLNQEKQDLMCALDCIVIDEISMVRADLMDCIDHALRMNRDIDKPFGGVQVIVIGDLFQLPPVLTEEERFLFEMEYTSPFFFSAHVMQGLELRYIELKKIFRQDDQTFIDLLNRIRNKDVTKDDITAWNERHDPYYDPTDAEGLVHLTTTNYMADKRNELELKKLKNKEWKFKAKAQGATDSKRMPAPESLVLKEGSQVMFTSNDPTKRWVNGTLGVITAIRPKGLQKNAADIEVKLTNGKTVTVEQFTWNTYEFAHNVKSGAVEAEVTGSYTQYPLTLAWAVTIHKAQGKTFDRIFLDMGRGAFAHGQLYVALSRCTTLEGIVLRQPFSSRDVIIDPQVMEFVKEKLA